jgi:hypothetical protein
MLALLLATSSQTGAYKAFPQVWAQPWCRDNCTQIDNQAECEKAASELKLGDHASDNVMSEGLPSCMNAAPSDPYYGLRWNKYGLLNKDMLTNDWLGFNAICKCAPSPPEPTYECIDDTVCQQSNSSSAVPKGQCDSTCGATYACVNATCTPSKTSNMTKYECSNSCGKEEEVFPL